MDPNATYKELSDLTDDITMMSNDGYDTSESEERFAVLFAALDSWIKSGGFLPTAWQQIDAVNRVSEPSRSRFPFLIFGDSE